MIIRKSQIMLNRTRLTQSLINLCQKTRKNLLLKKINPKEKPIACSECSSNFSTSHELSIHKSCHKKSEKMLICTKCVFECKTEQSFIIHSRSHTSGKPYACTDCDFTCPSKNTLKNHIKNHFCKKKTYVLTAATSSPHRFR